MGTHNLFSLKSNKNSVEGSVLVDIINWLKIHVKNDKVIVQWYVGHGHKMAPVWVPDAGSHSENMPIQIYRKFHLQKLKIFR